MSSTRLYEPDLFPNLPAFDASDARWIVELHQHQSRLGHHDTCPAIVHKVAIDLLTDSLYPSMAESSNPSLVKSEREKRTKDRARVTRMLGSRPLPSQEV
eukprot:8664313-Heterocapsa_arctica.AAC.1